MSSIYFTCLVVQVSQILLALLFQLYGRQLLAVPDRWQEVGLKWSPSCPILKRKNDKWDNIFNNNNRKTPGLASNSFLPAACGMVIHRVKFLFLFLLGHFTPQKNFQENFKKFKKNWKINFKNNFERNFKK